MKTMMIIACATAFASWGAILEIDPSQTVHATLRHNLIGSNIALWHQPWELSDSTLHCYVRELAPRFVRIPGGSWSNHYIWNGNGARRGDMFDLSRLQDGIWNIDWSDYAPGFNIEGDERRPVADNFHGSWDVKALHDFVEAFGAKAIVTVNLGSGTPEMAAEWVRWANKKNSYNVKYWELGNELEGSWELGHILPDGRTMNGQIYAERFRAFAEAMKAVDPTIKTGGPASSNDRGAFIQETLRDAGDLVDFISFHTYPVKNRQKSEDEFFKAIYSLEPAMDRIRSWIAEHQPERQDTIEIAITEWNSKVVEDRATADLMNGLWCTMWIGEMFRNGISFANQWDMMTATETGGHGLFYFEPFDFEQPGVPQEEMDRKFESFDPPCIPKGQYWALWLWSRFMGDRLVHSSLSGCEHLYSAVSRSDDGLQVLLVNTSRNQAENLKLELPGKLPSHATAIQLSHREYFWNPYTHQPQWSRRPEPMPIRLDRNLSIPPFSAVVVQVPIKKQFFKANQQPKSNFSKLEILLPESTPEDVPVEAWILAPEAAPCSVNEDEKTVSLTIDGPGRLDSKTIRINEGAGRFYITPIDTGTITVRTGRARAELQVLPVQSRIEILWPFETEVPSIASDFDLSLSDTAKPNQHTAAIQLDQSQPVSGQDCLLECKPIPDRIPKERVGGFAMEIKAAGNLVSADPHARLMIVLQSESDHWIPIGSLPLHEISADWEQREFKIEDHENLPAMQWLYAVRLQLSSSAPVTGELFINDAGLILR